MIDRYKNKILDLYFNNALVFDALILIVIWISNSFLNIIPFKIADKGQNISILSDTIAASISLAGFILASLTIIAAIKANIANKPPQEAGNPLELFFSPGNYLSIMRVFQGAIKELTFCFIIAYGVWISIENISNYTLFKILVSIIFLISISIVRSLMVLYKIVSIKDS